MQSHLTKNLKKLIKLTKEGKVITVAEEIKKLALTLDSCGYGKSIKELKND